MTPPTASEALAALSEAIHAPDIDDMDSLRTLASANAVVAALPALIKQVKAAESVRDDAGVDDIDPRLDYVMVQVSREVWGDFIAALARLTRELTEEGA
jgi:hypothetical protein